MALYGISITIDRVEDDGEMEQVCFIDGEFSHATGDGKMTKLLKDLREAMEKDGVDLSAWQWG